MNIDEPISYSSCQRSSAACPRSASHCPGFGADAALAIPELKQALNHPDVRVREAVERALRAIQV